MPVLPNYILSLEVYCGVRREVSQKLRLVIQTFISQNVKVLNEISDQRKLKRKD